MDSIVQWFTANLGPYVSKETLIFIISLFPILELRGGLLAASLLKVNYMTALPLCIFGNILPKRNTADGNRLLLAVKSQIDHRPQSVLSSRRNFHLIPRFIIADRNCFIQFRLFISERFARISLERIASDFVSVKGL